MKRAANIRLPPIATTIAWQYDLWRVRATLLTAGAPTLSLTDCPFIQLPVKTCASSMFVCAPFSISIFAVSLSFIMCARINRYCGYFGWISLSVLLRLICTIRFVWPPEGEQWANTVAAASAPHQLSLTRQQLHERKKRKKIKEFAI